MMIDRLTVWFLCVSVKPLAKPTRPAHICATCNKEFKNSYNLRRHQSVHTGIRMKDRAAREKDEAAAAKVARVEKQVVPLSLLQLTLPAQVPPTALTAAADILPQPVQLTGQEGQAVAVSMAPVVAAAAASIPTTVVVVGSMEQVGGANDKPAQVAKVFTVCAQVKSTITCVV